MRILISDYSGHPFQVQLSRALAARGHEVRHAYSGSFQTPKGSLQRRPDDAEGFSVAPVWLDEPFAKGTFVKRRRQEIAVGKLIGEEIARFRPDIVVSSNAPLDCQRRILEATRRAGAQFVFWVQDIYSRAISDVLARKLPVAGHAVGAFYRRLEGAMLRASDHLVLISADFAEPVRLLAGATVPHTVIENWAPLEELPPQPRDSEWARENLAPAPFRAVYSGTLGFKHDPGLLLALAREIEGEVLVYSEGDGADYLRRQAQEQGLANLRVSGWLPFDELPFALGAADVLIVILEADAGLYSVPSKTLTYLCAGRPILASMPRENLAARLIEANGAGLVAQAGDHAGFLAHARALAGDEPRRAAMARAARLYAEATFDIGRIADKFEGVFNSLSADTAADRRTG